MALDHVFQRRRDRGRVLRVEGDAVVDVPSCDDDGGTFGSEPFDNRAPDQPGAPDNQRDVTAQSEIHIDEASSLSPLLLAFRDAQARTSRRSPRS